MIPGVAGMDFNFIGTAVAAVLTFFVFGYLLGDLPAVGGLFKGLYRLALHILVGAGVAYALLVAGWSVFYPRVFVRLVQTSASNDINSIFYKGIALVGVLLGVFLLTKGIRAWAWLGNIATGYLIGVGLGVAVGGAVLGTLIPQSWSTATLSGARTDNLLWLIIDSVILVFGTLTVLISFTFTATSRRGISGWAARLVRLLSVFGRGFLYVALGAAFAGVYAASAAVLAGQAQTFINQLKAILVALNLGM
jgi:hypothetical protein